MLTPKCPEDEMRQNIIIQYVLFFCFIEIEISLNLDYC